MVHIMHGYRFDKTNDNKGMKQNEAKTKADLVVLCGWVGGWVHVFVCCV